jgi:uncharacterized protein
LLIESCVVIDRILRPKLSLTQLEELTPCKLHSLGIRGLLIDLDNTLLPLNMTELEAYQRSWLMSLTDGGVSPCLVSNAVPQRIERALGSLEIPYVARARKPLKTGYRKGLELLGLNPHECGMLGDQLFTDVFGANRLGIFSIHLRNASPIEQKWMKGVRKVETWLMRRHDRVPSLLIPVPETPELEPLASD